MDIESIIRKFSLKNAFDYGKANPGAVVGKVIAEFPDAKKDMKATMQKINQIINEVNALKKTEIENQLREYTFEEKKVEEKKLIVPNAKEGEVITRFPPEPSGYPHIGHAKAAFLDYELAKTYNGKMFLRFDDTNPEKESKEYVDAIKEGLIWLGIKWDKETYSSDNIEHVYAAAFNLIDKGFAYVCTCDQETISKGRSEMKSCQCRAFNQNTILELWDNMLSGKFKEGEAVLRFKGDLTSQNTVMRDPTLARIIKKAHYKQKNRFKVWPSYDLAVVVMDATEGITHPMRTKEYELRNELYYKLFEILGYNKPALIEFSRLEIKNAPISKRLLLPLIKEKKVKGWNDPRLPTLSGLKRRGILPEAIKNFVLSFGLSKVESEPNWEMLLSENRKLLDPVSKHYFFVPEPVLIELINAKKQTIRIKKHPRTEMGEREIKVENKIYIQKADFDAATDGEVIRLKDFCNVKLDKKNKKAEVVAESMVPKKIQWVSASKGEAVKTDILVPKDLLKEEGNFNEQSLERISGYAENECKNLEEEEVVQFERFGFCSMDKKGRDKLIFIFSC
ncbi:glutamate--tRNA ligase [Candidatus Micrarchaeota archaeon]|nr:glutamate--tRNA ligase [Candidatus Micrarchaeota archaeon]